MIKTKPCKPRNACDGFEIHRFFNPGKQPYIAGYDKDLNENGSRALKNRRDVEVFESWFDRAVRKVGRTQ